MEYTFAYNREGIFNNFLPNSLIDDPDLITLGVISQNTPIGVLCAKIEDFRIEIIWIYIYPKYRRKKAGTLLINEFVALLINSDQIYPLSIRCDTGMKDLYPFVKSLQNFDLNFIGRRFCIEAERIESSLIINNLIQYKARTIPSFFDKEADMIERFYRAEKKRGLDVQQLVSDGNESFIRSLCMCFDDGFNIDSLVLVKEIENNYFELSYAYGRNKIKMSYILIELSRNLKQNYSGKGLIITTLNGSGERLVRHMFGQDISCDRLYQSNWVYSRNWV